MNCLIIAAGHGSRLRDVSPSKPLTPVAGVPLIERVIRAAAAGGASAFTVVTGHEAARVEAFLATLTDFRDRDGARRRLGPAQRPFGRSPAPRAIDGDYLLTMSDHLFDPAIVRALIAAPPAPLTLAVDRDLANPLLDMDDATKVETGADGAILRDRQDARAVRRDRHRPVPRHARASPRRSARAAAACPRACSGSPTGARRATLDVDRPALARRRRSGGPGQGRGDARLERLAPRRRGRS